MEPKSMYKRGNKGLRWDMYRWDKLDRDEAHSKWVLQTGSKIGWINNQLIRRACFYYYPLSRCYEHPNFTPYLLPLDGTRKFCTKEGMWGMYRWDKLEWDGAHFQMSLTDRKWELTYFTCVSCRRTGLLSYTGSKNPNHGPVVAVLLLTYISDQDKMQLN